MESRICRHFYKLELSPNVVILRLDSPEQVPQSVIEDAAQLVKANSIQGNKINDVDVVRRSFWSSCTCALEPPDCNSAAPDPGVHNVG